MTTFRCASDKFDVFMDSFWWSPLDSCRVSRPHQSLRDIEMRSLRMTDYR